MNETIIVALISLAGTIIGSLTGVFATARLTAYRITKLEETVTKIEQLTERVFLLERHNEVQDTKVTTLEQRQNRIRSEVEKLREVKSNAS